MADGTQDLLPPGLLRAIAEVVATEMAKQPTDATAQDLPTGQPGQPQQPATPAQIGQTVGAALAPLAAPILVKAENQYKHPDFWVALGTILGLLTQNPLGLQLHPAAQVAIAAVAAIYVSAKAVGKGKRDG